MHKGKIILLMNKFLFAFIMLLCIASKLSAEEQINVFVSILPQQYFVERIGLDKVNVQVMVGSGQSPATYDPTVQQMAALAQADIYFSIGVPFEKLWLDKIKQNNRKLLIVNCCRELAHLSPDGNHQHDYDPHIWTNPLKVIQLVKKIKHSLVEYDSSSKAIFESAANQFINELTQLDQSIRKKIATLKKREMIVSHPSWGYFVDEYNLSQIPIEQDGREIQAKAMVGLITRAKAKNIKAIFVQKQFNIRAAKTIASELGAEIYEIDPLAQNYIENMNDVTNKVIQGLSHE